MDQSGTEVHRMRRYAPEEATDSEQLQPGTEALEFMTYEIVLLHPRVLEQCARRQALCRVLDECLTPETDKRRCQFSPG